MKREIKIKPRYECRCNGRLQTKRFTRLSHTGLVVELEHLKIMTRLTNEKFASVKGNLRPDLGLFIMNRLGLWGDPWPEVRTMSQVSSRSVSILVFGRNTVKIQLKYSKFELRLHDFTVFFMYFPLLPKLRYSKNTEFSIFTVFRHLNDWGKNTDFLDYVPYFFQKTWHQVFQHRTTQNGGREGEQEQVTMCWIQVTVYFSEAIDRQSDSPVIVRGLCDVWTRSTLLPS